MPITPSNLPCLNGDVVNVRITTEQLKLFGRCVRRCADLAQDTFPRTADEQEELEMLALTIDDTVKEPYINGDKDTVHGFAV